MKNEPILKCRICKEGVTSADARCLSCEAEHPTHPACWSATFALIQKAGGANLPRFSNLSFDEQCRVKFSFLGFFFGVAYYLAKGMWKKAISLYFVSLSFLILFMLGMTWFEVPPLLSLLLGVSLVGLQISARTSVDLYKRLKLGDDSWW